MLKAEEISVEKIKSGMGGYKKKETEEYIDTLRRGYEELTKENIELKDKLSVLSEGVQYYKNMEKSLQKALVLAEKTTSETMQAAEVKATAIEKEAQARADALLKEAQTRADALLKEAQTRADVLLKEAQTRADTQEKEAAINAENLVRDAKQQKDQEIASANEELRKIHSQNITLQQQYEQYKSQCKQLAMAQLQILESEAYNMDSPIIQPTSSFTKNDDFSNETMSDTNNSMQYDSQEIKEPVQTSVQSENTEPEKEKEVYIDGRGETVEVHEFREVSSSGDEAVNDPWDTEPEEDVVDDFDDPTQKYEGPYSFTQNDIPMNESVHVSDMTSSQNFNMDVPEGIETPIQTELKSDTVPVSQSEEFSIDAPVTSYKQEDNTNSNHTPVNFYNEIEQQIESEQKFESEPKVEFKPQLDFEPEFEQESGADQNKEVTRHNGNISLEEMKRIEKMQLERLREQEEKQLELLKSEHYHNHSNTSVPIRPAKEQEQKKEQDPADIFRALHKNDDSEPTVTLQDLKQQQELENSSVSLPKASVQSLSEETKEQPKKETTLPPMDDFLSFEPLDMTKQDNKVSKQAITFNNKSEEANSKEDDFSHQHSEQSENSFHTTPFVEEGNSLDFEMDNNQSTFVSEHRNTSKFKSFREFESEL